MKEILEYLKKTQYYITRKRIKIKRIVKRRDLAHFEFGLFFFCLVNNYSVIYSQVLYK